MPIPWRILRRRAGYAEDPPQHLYTALKKEIARRRSIVVAGNSYIALRTDAHPVVAGPGRRRTGTGGHVRP